MKGLSDPLDKPGILISKFTDNCGCKERRRNRIYRVSAIPAVVGRIESSCGIHFPVLLGQPRQLSLAVPRQRARGLPPRRSRHARRQDRMEAGGPE